MSDQANNIFDTYNPNDFISVYTRQNAIDDGIFVDVTRVAKQNGFTIPVAITSNLFNHYIKKDNPDSTDNNLNLFLQELNKKLKNKKEDNLYYLQFNFDANGHTDVWVALEAQSPIDPSPAMNIMLPSDW